MPYTNTITNGISNVTYSPVVTPTVASGIQAAGTNGNPPAPSSVTAPAAVVPPQPPASTINASNLAPQTAPAYPQPSTANTTQAGTALGSTLAASQASVNPNTATGSTGTPATTSPTGTPQDTSSTDTNPADAGRSSVLNQLLGIENQYSQEGTDTTAANTQYNIPGLTQQVTDLTNQYNAKEQYYNDQIANAQKANPNGELSGALTDEVTSLNQQKQQELADIAVQQQAASGNLSTAQALATAAVNAKYAPLKDEISTLQTWYQLSGDDLTDSEKLEAQQNIDQQNAQYKNGLAEGLAQYQETIKQNDPLNQAQVAEAKHAANAPYAGTTETHAEQIADTQKAQDNDVAGAVENFQTAMQQHKWAGADPTAYKYYKDALTKEYGASAGLALDAAMKTAGITVTPVPAPSKGGLFGTGLF